MYSQNNEEQVIESFFKEHVGRFLDCGAYDGKTFSNTLRLAELGWSGVCLEPSPTVYPHLKALHQANPHIICLQKALATTDGTIDFYDSKGDAVSTTEIQHVKKWEGYIGGFVKTTVQTMSINTLLDLHGTDYAFLNVDVEGKSADLFTAFPLDRLTKLKLICVEHDGRFERIKAHAEPYGFRQVAFNGENLILGRGK